MNDVLPSEIGRWQKVEAAFRSSMERLGYREVRTPYVEPTPLFVRTIGEATDVVEKEMYSFVHHDEALTLRPEGTAGAARAYVEHGIHNQEPVSRWYYAGPMFRAERPQKGRYRQFYQVGAECFGDAGPGCDAEMLDALVGFLVDIGIPKPDVFVNSLGSGDTRAKYKQALVEMLEPKKETLSADSQRRLDTNPLRILDSKHPADITAVQGAPTILDFLGDEDRAHWDGLRRHLDALGTPYTVDPKLVRGLDYYGRTLFEIKGAYDKLGAGSTLVGGGRYDGMVAELGGPQVPGIGFAAGLERLLIASEVPAQASVVDVLIAPIGDRAMDVALVLGRDVRKAGVRCEVDTRKASVKAQLRRANTLGARYAVILGDREIDEGIVELKDLEGHSQEKVAKSALPSHLASRLAAVVTVATALLVFLAVKFSTAPARAQLGGGGGKGGGPTQTSPTRNKPVGPRGGGNPDEDQGGASPASRPLDEPTAIAPTDPLAMPEGIADRIGSDYDGRPPSPEGQLDRSFIPLYQERRGDYRLRLLPPLYLEHTRGLDPRTGEPTPQTDRETLAALLFYQRRSPSWDADVLFPAFWRVRDRQNHVLVLGPLAHREAPNEHDNWIAPILFQGSRKDGGYFHSPLTLTSSHWDEKGAFTIVGPYFRDRTLKDVDWGVAPFYFHGDTGDEDGARKTYSLIPPLLYFHREREVDQTSMTVIGPVISMESPKRSVFDVAPFVFTVNGHPETGGVKEFHYTLFPLFHYGRDPDKSLFVLPGYLRRVTASSDTMITPFFTYATTRKKSTALTMVGPLVPIFYRSTDIDIGYSALGIFPFYYGSSSPAGRTFATPLYAETESFNVSRSHWLFPNILWSSDTKGWEVDVLPVAFFGRNDHSTHTVLAPILWDFASPKGRTTVGFPVYWRFADTSDDSVTQVALNTLYRQKRVSGGLDWQFHLLPLFSYGQSPTGSWANLLFGLLGYDHDGPTTKLKAFWLPFTVAGGNAPPSQGPPPGPPPASGKAPEEPPR
jgi:histidyl-tRNA synthetase